MTHSCGIPRARGRGPLWTSVARFPLWSLVSLSIGLAGACVPSRPTSPDASAAAAPPATVDCTLAEQGLEFFPITLANFEVPITRYTYHRNAANLCEQQADNYSGGQYFYSYFDGTSTIGNPGYQPPGEQVDRCDGVSNNHVLHMTGGPYLGWGGGMGLGLSHFASQELGLCTGDPKSPSWPSYCAPPDSDPNVIASVLNLSGWDGVAVWARRGLNSQPLLRVLVGTKDTDDDIAFLMYDPANPKKPLYCQRVRDCSCQFNDYMAGGSEHTCTQFDQLPADSTLCPAPTGFTYSDPYPPNASFVKGYYCGRPGSTPSTSSSANNAGGSGSNWCNTTMCDSFYSAYPNSGPDSQFAGKPCTPTTYRSGVQTSLCRRPDEPVIETDQQCGDHFTFPLHLTTDWKLYLIPFREMFQQGFGKQAATFDVKTISVVRLTWDAGAIDYYVDDLRFYRAKRD